MTFEADRIIQWNEGETIQESKNASVTARYVRLYRDRIARDPGEKRCRIILKGRGDFR